MGGLLRQGVDLWQFMHQARCGIHRQDRRAEPAATARGLRAYGLKPAHGEHS